MSKSRPLYIWGISLVLLTLVFPKYSLNSQAIILLFVIWIISGDYKDKLELFKSNLKYFIIVSSLSLITFLGVLYTSNFDLNVTDFKLPFLIFALIIFTRANLSVIEVNKILNIFSAATVLASVLGVSKAVWFMINGLGDYFYYLEFGKVLDKHPTYFSLFVCVAIINILRYLTNSFNLRNLSRVVLIFYLFGILYMLSSKISFICLFSVLILSIFIDFKKKGKKLFINFKLIPLLILPLIFLTPNLHNRIFKEKASNLSERLILWEAVTNSYVDGNVVFGYGTGDGHMGLNEEYNKVGYEVAAKNDYNAHNQYLEQLLFYGIIGLVLLIALLVFTIFKLWIHDFYYFLMIYFVFPIFMLSESIMERQSGIVFFAILSSIFLSSTLNHSNEKN